MCEMLEEMRNEVLKNGMEEVAERMIKRGKMSLEDIAEYVPALSLEELKAIEKRVLQLV